MFRTSLLLSLSLLLLSFLWLLVVIIIITTIMIIIAIIVILVSAKFIKAGFDARGEVKEEQREEKLKQEDEDILDELKRKNLSEEDLKDLYEKIQNNKKDKDE